MGITLTNNAHTTLSADASSTDTTFYVEDIDSFPSLDVGDYFYLTLERTSGAQEIVKVTQINASSFNVERGAESTIPISFPIGSMAKLNMTVQNITDLILTGSNINDDAYDSSWNGDTNDAPSRNAVYDKFVTVDAALAGYTAADVLAKLLTVDGTGSGLDADLLDGLSSAAYAQLSGAAFTGGISGTTASFSGASSFTSGALTVGFNKQTGDSAITLASDDNFGDSTSIIWTANGTTKWYLRHSASNGSLFLRNNSLGTSAVSFALASNNATFTGTVSVPDDAYAAGWDGNLTVPTKNAVYDKIQSLGTAALVDTGTSGTKVALTDGANTWSTKNTFTGAGSSSPRSSGTDAAFEVLNAAATQNYYFGIKDSDSNTLYIGRGHSAAQGITPAIKISSADAVTMTSLTTGAGGIDITGGAVNSVNGLHLFFSSNASRIYSLQNGVAWRDMYIDGATTYLNCNSFGPVVSQGSSFTHNYGSNGASLLYVGGANNQAVNIAFRANAGQSRGIVYYTGNSSARWFVEANSTAESGGNAGSDFVISNWDDAGAYIGSPFTITRSTGTTNISALAARIATSTETSGTLTSVSANKQINATGNITFNPSVFTAGDRGEIYAGSSSRTITQGTSMTLRLDGTATTGDRTLAAYGRASWYAVAHNEIIVTGVT